jgi:hypothetical protein
MPLRVAFDLDGTVADMRSALRAVERQLFGEDPGDREPSDAGKKGDGAGKSDESAKQSGARRGTAENSLAVEMEKEGLTLRQQQRVWQAVAEIENFWEPFDEIEPGAVKAIAGEAARRNWDVIFLTRRPASAGRTAQLQSQRWLQAHGFALPSVFVVTGSRGRIAEALDLDVVVDDLPSNCVDVVSDSTAKAILVLRGRSEKVAVGARRLGITVVPSIADCLETLVEIDDRKSHPSVAQRIKRAIGLAD